MYYIEICVVLNGVIKAFQCTYTHSLYTMYYKYIGVLSLQCVCSQLWARTGPDLIVYWVDEFVYAQCNLEGACHNQGFATNGCEFSCKPGSKCSLQEQLDGVLHAGTIHAGLASLAIPVCVKVRPQQANAIIQGLKG